MGGSDAGSGSKSKSRSLSSSSARRSSPSPQKRHEPSSERKRRSPSSASSSSSSASPSREKKTKKKKKQREVKKLKCVKKKEKKEKKWQKKLALKAERAAASVSTADEHPQTYLKTWQCEEAVMTDEQKGRLCTKRPMTKEDYEARQSVIRRVLDAETGRTRLVRGDGEILEEIVSKERHQEVNKQATSRRERASIGSE